MKLLPINFLYSFISIDTCFESQILPLPGHLKLTSLVISRKIRGRCQSANQAASFRYGNKRYDTYSYPQLNDS